MKIATMATGGIGGFLAVRLARAGHQVATIARGAHLEAIRANGLTLVTEAGRETATPWLATDDPSEVGPVDAIIFGVKSGGLDDAARACAPMLGRDTVVVPFLNGVEASRRLLTHLPAECVANGVAQISTTISAPGVITQTGTFNRFIFAERNSRPSPRIDTLRAAINDAGSEAPHTDNIERDMWLKFIVFSAASGITAAGRCTMADIHAHPALAALFRSVVAETTALARASGIDLPETVVDDALERAQNLPPTMRASTAIDIEQGNPLEIDWISGAVSRLSAAAGIDAPFNTALYALLLPHRDGRR